MRALVWFTGQPESSRMAKLVDLKDGEMPLGHCAEVMVISSAVYPTHCVSTLDHPRGRTYFATTSEKDIAIMVGRAIVYADRAGIAEVYLKRDLATLSPARKKSGESGMRSDGRRVRVRNVSAARSD